MENCTGGTINKVGNDMEKKTCCFSSGFPSNTMTSERSDEGSFIQEYLDWIY